MSFFSKLGHLFSSPKVEAGTLIATQVGAATLGAFNPGLGAFIETIGNAIYSVEVRAAAIPATGPEKKDQVKSLVDISAPVALSVLAAISGKPVKDPSAVAPAIDSIIDDLVALFHGIGVFPPKTTPAAVAPAAPVPSVTA